MNDLFDAIKASIHQYMNVDDLNPRKKAMVKETYGKFVYNMDNVDSLLDFGKEASDAEE